MDRKKVIDNTIKLLEKGSDKQLRMFYQVAYEIIKRY